MKRKFRDPKRVEKDVKKEVKRDRKVIGADNADAVREAIKTPAAVRKAEASLPSAPLSSVDTKSATKPLPKAGGEKSFSQAFREARSGGAKTFMWRGKSYTTQMKGEAPKRTVSAAKKPAAPAAKPAPAPAKATPAPAKAAPPAAKATPAKPAQRGPVRDYGRAASNASLTPRPDPAKTAAAKEAAGKGQSPTFRRDVGTQKPSRFLPGGKINPAALNPDGTFKYAKGGSIDGCAMRGKTKARKR